MNNGAAGWLALIFFGAAWYLNHRLEGNKWSPWIVLPVGVTASLMLYASTWAVWLAERFAAILEGVGGIFGANMPTATVMGILCILAIVGTFADLIVDSTYNVAAVWALVIAPVMAHGASGGVGSFVEGAYGGLTIAALQAVGNIFGG